MSAEANTWQAFYEAHADAMVLYARQFTPSLADAEDAVQAGFVRFWRARAKAKDSAAYLYACVRSAAQDETRAARRRAARETAAAAPPGAVGDAWFTCRPEKDEERRALEAALAELPLEQRAVVILKVWAGLTFDEIALLYRASPSTVASRYQSALGSLRGRLARALRPHQ